MAAFTYTPADAVNQGNLPGGLSAPQGLTWDGQQLVIVHSGSPDTLWALARNPDGTYAPANAVNQGNLPAGLGGPSGLTWDGQQLVIVDQGGDEVWTLARNANGSYTPANAVNHGSLPSGGDPNGVTWDGQQLVISRGGTPDSLWTLTRNSDGTYTPSNAASQGNLPTQPSLPLAVTWDGQQLILGDLNPDEIWTLARNPDGRYSPANVSNQGALPNGVGTLLGLAWDGQQIVFASAGSPDTLWTLAFDNVAPTGQIVASDIGVTAGDTITLTAEATDINPGDTLTYAWSSQNGGTFGDDDARVTTWTAPTVNLPHPGALLATLQCVVSDGEASITLFINIIVRTAPPSLALAPVADQNNATGDMVELALPEATGGQTPYIYSAAPLPPGLAFRSRRIVGIPTTPGTTTVNYVVTDSNQDMITRSFDWTVTGVAVPAPTGLNVRIDWGDLFFSNPHADVTGRITSDIMCERGRATASSVLARSQAGKMTFELQNSDGRFDEDNPDSPLFPLIRPGVQVQLRNGAAPLWTGVLDSIPTRYARNGQHRAEVTALGVLSQAVEPEVNGGSLTPESTAQAFIELCQKGNIPYESPQPQPGMAYVMRRWWLNGPLRQTLNSIEDTEGGFVFEDREGEVGFHLKGYRASRSKVYTFVAAAPGPNQLRILGDPRRELATKDVHNVVIGEVNQYQDLADQVLFEASDPVAVARQTEVTLQVEYPASRGAVISVDPPVRGTDWNASQNTDGTGTDYDAQTFVDAELVDFNLIEITLSVPVAITDPQAYVTGLQIKGSVRNISTPLRVTREDTTSLARYRRKTRDLRNVWIGTRTEMETRAGEVLTALAQPERRISLDWMVTNWADYLALGLSERVGINTPTLTADGFIEADVLRIPLDRALIVATMDVSLLA